MDKSTRTIVEALRKRRQKLAFAANVQRLYHADTPHFTKSLAEYEQLTAMIDKLDPPEPDIPPPPRDGWQQLPLDVM